MYLSKPKRLLEEKLPPAPFCLPRGRLLSLPHFSAISGSLKGWALGDHSSGLLIDAGLDSSPTPSHFSTPVPSPKWTSCTPFQSRGLLLGGASSRPSPLLHLSLHYLPRQPHGRQRNIKTSGLSEATSTHAGLRYLSGTGRDGPSILTWIAVNLEA